MKIIYLIIFMIIIALILFFHKYNSPVDHYSGRLLIGTNSSPVYSEVQVGSRFGIDESIMTFTENEFGVLNVFWNGVFEGRFNEGGIVINKNKGELRVSGQSNTVLLYYKLQRTDKDGWILVDKQQSSAGSFEKTFHFE